MILLTLFLYVIGIFIIAIIYSFLSMLITKKKFFSSFVKAFFMISFFVFLFIWIYALIGYFIPNKRHGSFNDNWYVEIQNGYMLEFIDDFENGFIRHNEEIIIADCSLFLSRQTIFVKDDLIMLKNLDCPNKLTMINTTLHTHKEIDRPWKFDNGVEIKDNQFESMENFYDKLNNRFEYIVQLIVSLLLSFWIIRFISKKR